MNLTIAYVTSRKEPHLEWFVSSLKNQLQPDDDIQLIVVGDHKKQLTFVADNGKYFDEVTWTFPKPNVWSGPHRLTKEDWFSAANTRNTSVCYCKHPWIAFADDLSVLEPGWLQSVREAMAGSYAVFGAYQKVNELIVKDGRAVHFKAAGIDNRLELVTSDVSPATGSWCYGCSLALPLEWVLQVNGFPEALCDGMGFEDVLFGFALQNNGFPLRFDRRMMTIESEEHHHTEPAKRREDYGVSPNDKSHRALDIAMQTKYFGNDFGSDDYSLRSMRNDILAGYPFPIRLNPRHEWFTGKLLSEL
jgi:GT2 family glycosyltransferase